MCGRHTEDAMHHMTVMETNIEDSSSTRPCFCCQVYCKRRQSCPNSLTTGPVVMIAVSAMRQDTSSWQAKALCVSDLNIGHYVGIRSTDGKTQKIQYTLLHHRLANSCNALLYPRLSENDNAMLQELWKLPVESRWQNDQGRHKHVDAAHVACIKQWHTHFDGSQRLGQCVDRGPPKGQL